MPRRPRADEPGSWHHAINRAIGKRPYFESRTDQRYFLSRLAYEVRAGRIEVHAYSLMTTHFHLLLRSPVGELSEAMRRIQSAYSRHFNRRHKRDGPLIRARFYSKRVRSDAYRRAVVRYIDTNPVRAGVVGKAVDHEFGSARSYLSGSYPRWLASDWIANHARERTNQQEFNAAAYLSTFGPRAGEDFDSLRSLIELRLDSPSELDPLEDLVGANPQRVQRWMARKANLADGMPIGLPVCGPSSVTLVLDHYLERNGEWYVDTERRSWRGSQIAQIGLLRDLCGLPFKQIASLCASSPWHIQKKVRIHHQAVGQAQGYATVVAGLAQAAVAATLGE